MDNISVADQEFACEDCGFTSPLTDDVCPNCGGRMTALDAPIKKGGAEKDANVDDTVDGAEDAYTGTEDGSALSLERLQEEESRDANEADDYGDGDS